MINMLWDSGEFENEKPTCMKTECSRFTSENTSSSSGEKSAVEISFMLIQTFIYASQFNLWKQYMHQSTFFLTICLSILHSTSKWLLRMV